MTTRVCVLRTGKEYGVQHARWLAQQVPDIVCVSNVHVPGVKTIAMPTVWPGWWSKMNLFNPALIDDDLLYFDLDTVVLGDLDQFNVGRTTTLSDFYRPHLPASGFMYIKHEDKRAVWDEWMRNPERHMARCVTRERWGDQGFLRDLLPHQRWESVLPGKVVSYKVHCQKGVPPGAAVVCFHGKPRPWESGRPWVPNLA
jgi:hypothetical protein